MPGSCRAFKSKREGKRVQLLCAVLVLAHRGGCGALVAKIHAYLQAWR